MRYSSFRDFYPFYLAQHSHPMCRRLHFIGLVFVLGDLIASLMLGNAALVWMAPVFGYGFGWLGHFIFEKNKPTTFQYPLYSFMSDWVMCWEMLTGNSTFRQK